MSEQRISAPVNDVATLITPQLMFSTKEIEEKLNALLYKDAETQKAGLNEIGFTDSAISMYGILSGAKQIGDNIISRIENVASATVAEILDRIKLEQPLTLEELIDQYHLIQPIIAIGNVETGQAEQNMYVLKEVRRQGNEKSFEAISITNFVVKLITKVVGDNGTFFEVFARNDQFQEIRFQFTPTDFSSLRKFKEALTRYDTIGFVFTGTEKDFDCFRIFLEYLVYRTIEGVPAAGMHLCKDSWVYVDTKGAFDATMNPVSSIIQLQNREEIKASVKKYDPINLDKLLSIGKPLLTYTDQRKTTTVLAWVAACFVKQHLRANGVKFPHLLLIGQAGSGKSTTLETILQPIFSVEHITAAGQTTDFTLIKSLSSSNTIPLLLDEFKPSQIQRIRLDAVKNKLREAYDMQRASRGNADKSTTYYDLTAPIVIVGEAGAGETAIKERSLELLFTKADFNDDRAAAMEILKENQEQLHKLGKSLLLAALDTSVQEVKQWYKETSGVFSDIKTSRAETNARVAAVGLKLLSKVCESYGTTFEAVFGETIEASFIYIKQSIIDFVLDGKLESVSIVETTLETIGRMELNKSYCFVKENQLYIRTPLVYDQYTKYVREHNIPVEVLPLKDFTKQLRASDICIKSNFSVRPIRSENAIEAQKPAKFDVIDLEKLKSRCENIEIYDDQFLA